MGRCTWDSAQEVRNGMLERDEAVALINKYDSELPSEYMNEILEYLELSIDEFTFIVDQFRPQHLWDYSSEHGFSLKHTLT